MSNFSFLHYAITALIFYGIYRLIKNLFGAGGKPMHCLDCGTESKSTIHTKGSTLIEIVAWLAFIIPGIIYSLWRVSSRGQACATCGSTRLIPIDSPAAIAHKKQLGQ